LTNDQSTGPRAPSTQFAVHPADIVSVLHGSPNVLLSGFDTEPMPGSWLRPALRFVSTDGSEGGVGMELEARAFALRCIKVGTAAAMAAAIGGAGFWVGAGARPAPTTAGAQSQQWFVAGVGAKGITINSNSVSLLVSPGELLPNGEVLQAVIPARNTYITDRAAVVVQAAAGASGLANSASKPSPALRNPGETKP